MAEIPVNPFDMEDVDLEFGEVGASDNYKQHVSRVRIEPGGAGSSWVGLAPNAVHRGKSPGWTANLALAQDWDNPDSLCRFLYDNEGDTIPVRFRPRTGATGFDAVASLVAPAIGGDVNTTATSEVALPLAAKPTLIPAAP